MKEIGRVNPKSHSVGKLALQGAMDLSYDKHYDGDDARYAYKLSINAIHVTGALQFSHSDLFIR